MNVFLRNCLLIVFCLPAMLAAKGWQCRNVVVNYEISVWEEGFGEWHADTDEDSRTTEVSYDSRGRLESLEFGQAGLKPVKEREEPKAFVYSAKEDDDTYELTIYKKSKRGIAHRELPSGSREILALVDCSSTRVVEKADIGDENVKSGKWIPNEIYDRINQLDIGFELGDGYYDVVATRYFTVYNADGSVAGYLKWAKFTYTEGEGGEIVLPFDRNGLRLEFDLGRHAY